MSHGLRSVVWEGSNYLITTINSGVLLIQVMSAWLWSIYCIVVYIYSMPCIAVPCCMSLSITLIGLENNHILHEDSTTPHAYGWDTIKVIYRQSYYIAYIDIVCIMHNCKLVYYTDSNFKHQQCCPCIIWSPRVNSRKLIWCLLHACIPHSHPNGSWPIQ